MTGLLPNPPASGLRGDGPTATIVEVTLPADPRLFATIRAVARSAAVLADLTANDVEELQIAVTEAASLLLPLPQGADAPVIKGHFEVAPGFVRVVLSTPNSLGAEIDSSGMPWILLSGLDTGAEVSYADATASIALTRARADSRQ